MKMLTKEQILLLHQDLIDTFGGEPGLRDGSLLESAPGVPFQTFEGEMLYPTLQAQAARLGYGLVENHPFVDGNKRMGAHAMLIFLALNGVELEYSHQELIDVILSVAAGKIDFEEFLNWVKVHQKE